MELNIQDIANQKIQSMHDSGLIKQKIEEGIEKLILGAITDALGGYSVRHDIEKNISDNVSAVAKEVGFSAYNGFIAQKIKEITEGAMRDDVAQKIQKVFSDMLVIKHDGIKLSDIFSQYRERVNEDAEYDEKQKREQFTCDLSVKEDGNFKWYTVKFSKEKLVYAEDADIEFRLCVYGAEDKASISNLEFGGKSMKGTLSLGHLDDMETLLANLYFNETKIILDIEDIDDNDYYETDD